MIHRLVQWRYVLPRIIIAAIALVGAWIAVEPVLHGFLTGIGERIIRAKVDIEDVGVSLRSCDLSLTGVQVANPRALDRNLIECESATFDIEAGSVLARRLTIRSAQLRGVRFNTRRSTSGRVELPPLISTDVPDNLQATLIGLDGSALAQFAEIMALDLQEELVSIRLARELATRWPEEYRKLAEQATAISQQIKALQRELNADGRNPAGMSTAFPEKMAEVERLRRELYRIRGDLDRLARQVAHDRDTIDFARRHDEQVIRRKLTLADIDEQALSEYLLGDELSSHTREMLSWIKLARRYWPSEVELPPAERSTGEDIVPAGIKPLPRALVQRMLLEGTIESYGRTVPWRGEIRNLTTDPALVIEPLVIRAQTEGKNPVIMQATLDRRTATPRDHVVLSLPSLEQPSRKLGKGEELALLVPPGNVELWAELCLDGEALSGRMVVQQKEIRLASQLAPRFGERLAQRVATATEQVSRLEAEVTLSGTLDKPSWKLRSNLGPQLAGSLTTALRDELAARETELTEKLAAYLQRQQRHIDERLALEQQNVSLHISQVASEIDDLKRVVAGRVRIPGRYADDLPVANPYVRR